MADVWQADGASRAEGPSRVQPPGGGGNTRMGGGEVPRVRRQLRARGGVVQSFNTHHHQMKSINTKYEPLIDNDY